MKVNRERKVYAAVLGLVVLGFALDRTIYGGSHEASAELTTPDAAVVPATAPAAALGAVQEEPSLATRLASTVEDPTIDPASIREPFCKQLPWNTVAPAAAVEAAPNLAEQFAARHTLTATMGSLQNGIAIIDGNCVRIGKSIDGFRLVSVDRRSALLESNGARVTLGLKTNVVLGQ